MTELNITEQEGYNLTEFDLQTWWKSCESIISRSLYLINSTRLHQTTGSS